MQISTLLVGGGETLAKIIARGILQLDAHPDQCDALVHDPSIVPSGLRRDGSPRRWLSRRTHSFAMRLSVSNMRADSVSCCCFSQRIVTRQSSPN